MLRFLQVLLSFGGVFVAGSLTLLDLNSTILPCGARNSCALLAADPRSSFLGVPIALFGLLGYLLLASLMTYIHTQASPPHWALKLTSGMLIIGGAASVGLILALSIIIRIWCPWCLASAAIMLGTALTYSCWLNVRTRPLSFLSPAACATVAATGLLVVHLRSEAIATHVEYNRIVLASLSQHELAPSDSIRFTYGVPKRTFIVFSDPYCDACSSMLPKLLSAAKNIGNTAVIYRHFPFSTSRKSMERSFLLEIAGERGELPRVNAEIRSIPDNGKAKQRLAQIGLLGHIDRRLADPADPAWTRIRRDRLMALRLGLSGAPMILLLEDHSQPKVLTPLLFHRTFHAAIHQ